MEGVGVTDGLTTGEHLNIKLPGPMYVIVYPTPLMVILVDSPTVLNVYSSSPSLSKTNLSSTLAIMNELPARLTVALVPR